MKHERSPLLVHISKGSCWDTLTVRGESIYFNTWATRAGWKNLSAVAECGIPRSAHGFSLLRDLFSGKYLINSFTLVTAMGEYIFLGLNV